MTVNDVEITPDGNDVYTIENITEDKRIAVTGVEEQKPCIIAPAGSTVTIGTFGMYFKYTFVDPYRVETLKDGRVKTSYDLTSGDYFVRVQNPDGVTFWDYGDRGRMYTMTSGAVYEITESDLHMDDPTFNADTLYQNFEYNNLDLGDIYLNINANNYLSLSPGQTKELNSFRNWFAINSFTNDKVAIPDMHYEVVDINGNPSDLVTIEPDQYNSTLASRTAGSGTGMAIVKVTYDAMYYKQAYGTVSESDYGQGGEDPRRFSAIWPERTGVFVVTVGQDGSSIDTGMKVNESRANNAKPTGAYMDGEHDLFYYVGDKGAQFSFTPESGAEVSVARSTLNARSLDFNGFTTDGVSVSDGGAVTVSGLTAGRHIIKVEKGGVANYQVLTARQISIDLAKADGTPVAANEIVDPGTELTATFTGVTSPIEKLSGNYNGNFQITYNKEDGSGSATTRSTGAYGYYAFSKMTPSFTFTIPANWEGATYSLTEGTVRANNVAEVGSHRQERYLIGRGSGAYGMGAFLGVMPDITVKTKEVNTAPAVAEGVQAQVKESVFCDEDFSLNLDSVFTDADGDTLAYKVAVDGAEPVDADMAYRFEPDGVGSCTLVFTANDGKEDSADTYTVELTVAHDLQHVDAVAATCEEDGTLEHWKCNRCNKLFGDVQGAAEVDAANLVDPATGHSWGTPKYTWAEDGSKCTAERACAHDASHKETEEGTVTPEVTKPATCTEMGETTYTAKFDNAAFAEQTKVVADVEKLGHAPGEAVEENRVEPACGAAGSYDEVVYCTVCGEEISREAKAIDALAHELEHVGAVAATCAAEGVSEHWKCGVCEKLFSDAEGKAEVSVADTVVAVDPDAHAWGEPIYTWDFEAATVTAERACAHDATHVETETVEATSKVTKEPAVGEPGELTWTSDAFANPAFEVQTVTEPMDALSELVVVNGRQQTWVKGERREISATAEGLADGEVVVKWTWEYSKDGETGWKRSGASTFADGASCSMAIPECTVARKAPMAWRATAVTNLGRSATGEPQDLHELKDLSVAADGEFSWVEGEAVDIRAWVSGLAPGEQVASYQWYYSRDRKTYKKTGAASRMEGGDALVITIPECTQARKSPMAWSVRITTTDGRTATSEDISLGG